MKTAKTVSLAFAALALTLGVMPTASATDPYVCDPSGSVCAGGQSFGDPECGYGQDWVYITPPTGGWIIISGSHSCYRSGDQTSESQNIIVNTDVPGLASVAAYWYGSSVDGEDTDCGSAVIYSTAVTGDGYQDLGCPAGPPPALPWGHLLPEPPGEGP